MNKKTTLFGTAALALVLAVMPSAAKAQYGDYIVSNDAVDVDLSVLDQAPTSARAPAQAYSNFDQGETIIISSETAAQAASFPGSRISAPPVMLQPMSPSVASAPAPSVSAPQEIAAIPMAVPVDTISQPPLTPPPRPITAMRPVSTMIPDNVPASTMEPMPELTAPVAAERETRVLKRVAKTNKSNSDGYGIVASGAPVSYPRSEDSIYGSYRPNLTQDQFTVTKDTAEVAEAEQEPARRLIKKKVKVAQAAPVAIDEPVAVKKTVRRVVRKTDEAVLPVAAPVPVTAPMTAEAEKQMQAIERSMSQLAPNAPRTATPVVVKKTVAAAPVRPAPKAAPVVVAASAPVKAPTPAPVPKPTPAPVAIATPMIEDELVEDTFEPISAPPSSSPIPPAPAFKPSRIEARTAAATTAVSAPPAVSTSSSSAPTPLLAPPASAATKMEAVTSATPKASPAPVSAPVASAPVTTPYVPPVAPNEHVESTLGSMPVAAIQTPSKTDEKVVTVKTVSTETSGADVSLDPLKDEKSGSKIVAPATPSAPAVDKDEPVVDKTVANETSDLSVPPPFVPKKEDALAMPVAISPRATPSLPKPEDTRVLPADRTLMDAPVIVAPAVSKVSTDKKVELNTKNAPITAPDAIVAPPAKSNTVSAPLPAPTPSKKAEAAPAPITAPTTAPAVISAPVATAAPAPAPAGKASTATFTVKFDGDSTTLSAKDQASLKEMASTLPANDERVTVKAYAKGVDTDPTVARRISLQRSLTVRSFLIDNGVFASRVDVRALGRDTDQEPLDRVDVTFPE